MAQKIRVFVSSTIKDLANERDAILREIAKLNFEPVNVEGWLPTGVGSWDKICTELESSHVFVLVLGERYGWIPSSAGNPRALSVTHMEFERADQLGLPVLIFQKKLEYDTVRDTVDAARRDQFRQLVAGWSGGRFIAEFWLAHDLAQKVGESLVLLLSEDYLRSRVQDRRQTAVPIPERASSMGDSALKASHTEEITLSRLVSQIVSGRAVLIAGAGMSLEAGFPSGRALVTMLSQIARLGVDPGVAGDVDFPEVAGMFEDVTSREVLIRTLSRAIGVTADVQPTNAHLLAVTLFDRIITTNFDDLFERAFLHQNLAYTRLDPDSSSRFDYQGRLLFKLSGSLDDPRAAIITDTDLRRFQQEPPAFWNLAKQTIRSRTPVIVGTSMRDPRLQSLLFDTERQAKAFFVAPRIDTLQRRRLERYHIEVVLASAEGFFRRLQDLVEGLPPK